jgi:hypothetical protein
LQVRCGSNTGKRSTSLRIDFDVEIEANSDVQGDMFKNLTFQQYSILQRMKMDIHNGTFVIDLNDNITIYALYIIVTTTHCIYQTRFHKDSIDHLVISDIK